MKTVAILVASLTILSSSAQPDPKEEIIKNLNAALELWYQGNTAGYVGLHADDFTYFDTFVDEKFQDQYKLQEHFNEFIPGNLPVSFSGIRESQFQELGDNLVHTYKLNDRIMGMDIVWRATEVYTYIGGEWKIVSTHWSMFSSSLLVAPKMIVFGVGILLIIIAFLVGRWLGGRQARNKLQAT